MIEGNVVNACDRFQKRAQQPRLNRAELATVYDIEDYLYPRDQCSQVREKIADIVDLLIPHYLQQADYIESESFKRISEGLTVDEIHMLAVEFLKEVDAKLYTQYAEIAQSTR